MAKTSGGVRKGGGLKNDGGGNYKGSVKNIGSLKDMENRSLQKEVQRGITKFESRLGVRTDVKLADLDGAVGVHQTINGKSAGVYLDRGVFEKGTTASVTKMKRDAYKSGFLNPTNRPTQHTVVHELAHALWNNKLTSSKALKASPEIQKLYRTFKRENPKSWGSYGKTNINEFVAEGITKGVLAKGDKYSNSLIKIVKKYGL